MQRPCNCDNCPKTGEPWTGVGCYDCWRFYNVPKVHKEWGGTNPNLLEKINNFANALVKHVMSGCANISPEILKQRKLACTNCPLNVNWKCQACGCNLLIKMKWASTQCPKGKWPTVCAEPQTNP